MPRWNETREERFWKQVRIESENECWIWTGSRTKNGGGARYGGFSDSGKTSRAHRVSYEMDKGEIPRGMVVRHKCDNTLCVNPHHLEVGTQKQNVADRDARGRSVYRKGEKHGLSKITEDIVRIIRDLIEKGYLQKDIAFAFGITPSSVTAIKKRRVWAHVGSQDG